MNIKVILDNNDDTFTQTAKQSEIADGDYSAFSRNQLNRLTLFMNSHHHGPVLWVDAEQDGGPHQVLRQVAQQWHSPENSQ